MNKKMLRENVHWARECAKAHSFLIFLEMWFLKLYHIVRLLYDE